MMIRRWEQIGMSMRGTVLCAGLIVLMGVLAACATMPADEAGTKIATPAMTAAASPPSAPPAAPAMATPAPQMSTAERLAPASGPLGGELADIPPGDAERGRKLFNKAWTIGDDTVQCIQCHSLIQDGELIGGSSGPTLNQVTLRRNTQWLFNWLWDPTEMFPRTPMPVFPWNDDQEVADVVAFLGTLKTAVDKEKIVASGDLVNAGKQLVKEYDCRACHTIGRGPDGGGIVGYPELTVVGSKIRPEWEREWLKDPQKMKPGTFMPSFDLTEKEFDAVTAYLHSLKWDRKI